MSQYNSNIEMKKSRIIKIALYIMLLTMALMVAGCVEK
jgi:flagellar basal body-associated protein FliL